MQFFGTYNHRIDAKGRLALPAKIRKAYDKAVAVGEISSIDLVAMLSPSKDCVYVFTVEDYNAWIKAIFEQKGGYNPKSKDDEKLMRALRKNATEVSIDGSGRINIPADLRSAAGLKSAVSIVGSDGHFEIWDEGALEEELSEIDLGSLLYE